MENVIPKGQPAWKIILAIAAGLLVGSFIWGYLAAKYPTLTTTTTSTS